MRKSLRINGLILSMLLLADVAGAAGLGRLSVMSALGQPLKAEIELLSMPQEEIGSLSARLASAEAFRQARLDRADALNGLQFNIAQRPGGQPVLRISSSTPVSDPFLDLLIELNWSSGRILREYTVLLDPPREAKAGTDPMAQVPAQAAPVKEPVVRDDPSAAAPAAAKPAQEAAAKPPVPADKPAGSGPKAYGPVKAGETLRSIAGKVQHPEATIEMMMAGLYEANKKAFARNNINLLRKGQTLSVPESESLAKMFSQSQARALVREHGAAWNAYRAQVADMAASAPSPTPVEKKENAAGKIVSAPTKDKPTPAPAQGADVLKLSKGQPVADAKAQQRQQMLEEEVAAKGRALKEANERVAQLENTVKDMQQLIKMKDQQAKSKAPEPAAPVVEAKPSAPAEAKPEPVKVEPPPAPKETSAEEPGFIASLLDKPLYIGGAIAAILLGILGWMLLGRRRHSNMAQLEQSVLNSGDDFKTAIFRTTAGAVSQANTQQTSVMTDFSRLGLGAIDTHEVDPIAEAEVYMAYGRDAQAEEILKEALNRDSGRHEIALKLLEIYAARSDTAAFETQASEIYAALAGAPTPLWQKVTELGRSIDPQNPLYQFKGSSDGFPEAPEAAPYPTGAESLREMSMDDFDTPAAPQEEAPEAAKDDVDNLFTDLAEAVMPGESAPAQTEDLDDVIDFQLDMDTFSQDSSELADAEITVQPAAPASVPNEVDDAFPAFDMGDFALPEETPAQPVVPARTPFDEPEAPQVPAAEAMPDLDFSGIDLELSEPAPAAPIIEAVEVDIPPATLEAAGDDDSLDPEIVEEVNTKLDLAKAYLEMGDKEGAREILEEALQEGTSQQKALARDLMASSA